MPDSLPQSSDPFLDPAIPDLAQVLTEFEALPDETPSRKIRVPSQLSAI
jgi:hypothetical protein